MVQLPPALLIAAQVVIGTLLGVLGVVFATPLTACALVLTQRLVRPVTSARPAAPSSAQRPR